MNQQARHKTKHVGVTYRLKGNGERSYYIDYLDSMGRRVHKRIPGKLEDARRERARVLDRMGKGELVVFTKMTVSDLAEEWLDSKAARLKPKTLAGYGYMVDHYIIPRLGQRKVVALGVHDIAWFVNDMLKAGYKAWTIRGCLTPLSGMMHHAVRRGWISSNPVKALDSNERPQSDQKKIRILSTEEIAAILEAAKDSVYRLPILTAIFSGLRQGELLALEWDDVDLLGATIRVRESKTEAGVREVVIPDFLVRALAGYSTSEGLVFQTKRGTAFGARNVLRGLHEAQERAGVERTSFHALRHTFASILIAQGENIAYVADQMGHANPAITLKLYAKLFESQKSREEARKRMNQNFEGVAW